MVRWPLGSLTATSLQRPLFFVPADKNSIHWLFFKPLYNGRLFTWATFFCPQCGRCRERASTVFSRFPKLQVKLLEIFSEFGLVYEVQVIDSSDYSEGKGSIESLVHDQPTEPSLWMWTFTSKQQGQKSLRYSVFDHEQSDLNLAVTLNAYGLTV